ncbi:unnamed protein product [Schistosoma turkestanicum]|nr:unnamed protein product [Schistosoma turkestanicum]
MSTLESISNNLNLCSNESRKLIKTNNPYRKLHNSNSFNSEMINAFNNEQYYTNSNNKINTTTTTTSNSNNLISKDEMIECSNDNSVESNKLNPILAIASHQWFDRLFPSNSYANNHYHHHHHSHPHPHPHHHHNNNNSNQRPYCHHNHHHQLCLNFESSQDHFGRTRLNSNYSGCCQTTEDNLLTTQSIINNLELTRFNEMHNCNKTIDDNRNDNNIENNNEINETNDVIDDRTETDFNKNTKYGYNSTDDDDKSPINSTQFKTHSSNLDYETELNYNTTNQFTNYSTYLTEFDKNELIEMENKQHILNSDGKNNNNSTTSSSNNSNVCSDSLRAKGISELNENSKKSRLYLGNECKTKQINGSYKLNNSIITDKSYHTSFESEEISDSCLNPMTINNENLKLYNDRSTTKPFHKSSSSSPQQSNSQKMLNNETVTTTSLLDWHSTPGSDVIDKIKPDNNNNNNNERLLLGYKPQFGDQSSVSVYNGSSFINNTSKINNKKNNTYDKFVNQTDDHSPPLSYSSQSTDNLNDDSIRTSHQHSLHSQPHPNDKSLSNFNHECIWKESNHHSSDSLSFDNEINYIKNQWNSNHNLLINKLRFHSNITTSSSTLPVATNNTSNELNFNERTGSFDSMIPCISHNFLTNFTRTSYDNIQSNSTQEHLYGLPSSHLNTNGNLMGSFTGTNLFNIDGGNHPASTSSNTHNKLEDEYDCVEEHCLGTYNHSHQQHQHHHTHNQFMGSNCGNCDYNLNFRNDLTLATGSTTNNFKTSLNCYLLPPMNGFNDNAANTNHSQLTDGVVASDFKTRLNSSNGYPQNFAHSAILGCNHSNSSIYRHPVELDYNPRELEAFSELFKQRRIKLGVTQADVGKALGNLKISGVGSLSQSTICRFESLTLSHNNMVALKPVLQAWLEEAEAEASSRLNHPSIYDLDEERRRKRTSITDSEKRSLEAFFSIQPRPSSEKIAQIAEKLNLKKNVVRVWFCNQRQKQKRMKFSTLGMLHHSATRT